jgi:hypothetical protein
VLGAEVLLGFQLRGAFQAVSTDLPATSKVLDATALIVMMLVVGFLMTPAIHHRIVDDGNVTARIFSAINSFITVALLPFAISLGLDVS